VPAVCRGVSLYRERRHRHSLGELNPTHVLSEPANRLTVFSLPEIGRKMKRQEVTERIFDNSPPPGPHRMWSPRLTSRQLLALEDGNVLIHPGR
jgi:hypothetical protein